MMRIAMNRLVKIFAAMGAAVLFLCCPGAFAAPAVYMNKVEDTPDMGQRDGIGFLPHGGRGYCAPVAVSNALMWLNDNGFDGLVDSNGDQRISQLKLAALLGDSEYMKTDSDIGTGPSMVMRGIAMYLVERGHPDATLEYQGWREHPEMFSTGVQVPSLEWIKEGLVGHSAVWLNIGWYKYDPATSVYGRVGGHWVTLVGYGANQEGKPDPSMLVIHDPALKKKRTRPTHRYVRAQAIRAEPGRPEPILSIQSAGYFDQMAGTQDSENGKDGQEPGLPRSAVGYLKLTGQMRIQHKADFAIVDSAIVLRMKPPPRAGRR